MANPRPPFFTFIDRLLTNVNLNYAESPLNLTGVKVGDIIESIISNTLWLSTGLWQVYQDYGTKTTDDDLDTTTTQRWSSTKLAYTVGQSVLAVGSSVDTQATYYFMGCRIHIDDIQLKPAGASPLIVPVAVTPGRVWVYVDAGVINAPAQPTAVIRVDAVGPAAVPTPGPNELALVGVDIDIAGLVTGNTYPAVEPKEEIVYGPRSTRWTAQTTFEDTANYSGSPLAQNVEGKVEIDGGVATDALLAQSNGAGPTVEVLNPGGRALGVTATSVSSAVIFQNDGAGEALRAIKLNAGTALRADTSAGGGTAVEAFGGALGVDANSDTGRGVQGTTLIGFGVHGEASTDGMGVAGVGGSGVASRGGLFVATNLSATGLRGETASGAVTAASVAVQGVANGDGVGVQGLGLDGYGIVAQSDTTTPTRAAVRIVPQDADPSTFLQGDYHFGSNRGPTGKLRVYTTQHESVHSSDKGLLAAFGANASGGPIAGGTGNQSTVQVSPEEVGDVMVVATGSLTYSSDTDFVTVILRDETATVNFATQIERAPDIDLGANRVRSFVIRARYTLPSTATRTFAVQITAGSGSFDYDNTICSLQGVE